MLFSAAAMVVATVAVGDVGEPIESVAVPLDSVAVTMDKASVSLDSVAKPIDEVAASLDSVVVKPASQLDLVSIIRSESSPEARMEAFNGIVDGDIVFRMIFKPGANSTGDVRLAAIRKVADVEVVKFLAAKSPDPDAKKVAEERLASIYADPSDRKLEKIHQSVRSAVRRTSAL